MGVKLIRRNPFSVSEKVFKTYIQQCRNQNIFWVNTSDPRFRGGGRGREGRKES